MSDGEGRVALRQRSAEIAVAAFFLALGAIVAWDSARLGAKWGSDGPEAGYFPFYIGLLTCFASLVNLLSAAFSRKLAGRPFVHAPQLKLVLSVLVPAAIYVAAIGWIGIYVASTVFIAFFMRWLGKYPWWKVVLVSIGNSVVFFFIFEIWFKVPLPKGPLEAWLGLN